MKSILQITIIFYMLFSTNPLFAQAKRMTKLNSFDLGYGQKILQNDFYGELSNFDNVKIFAPLSYIGFGGYSAFARNEKSFYSGHIFYQQVIPQSILIADTISGKISGFNLAATLVGMDLLGKSERFDFLVGFGFNTGRLRTYKNDLIKQKNPYFSPKISITPRAKLGNMVVSLNVDYEFDISKSGWRGTAFAKDKMINIANLRQSGFNAFLSIGKYIGDSGKESYGREKKKEK